MHFFIISLFKFKFEEITSLKRAKTNNVKKQIKKISCRTYTRLQDAFIQLYL